MRFISFFLCLFFSFVLAVQHKVYKIFGICGATYTQKLVFNNYNKLLLIA